MMSFVKQFSVISVTILTLVGCAAPVPIDMGVSTTPPAVTSPITSTEPITSVDGVTGTESLPVTEPVSGTLPTEPITSTDTLTDTSTDGAVMAGNVVVESIEVRILESFPVQVHAVVRGYLPDGCTTITGAEVANEGIVFLIQIMAQRPLDAICTMAIVEFEQVVILDTANLPARTYEVVAGEQRVSFDLP